MVGFHTAGWFQVFFKAEHTATDRWNFWKDFTLYDLVATMVFLFFFSPFFRYLRRSITTFIRYTSSLQLSTKYRKKLSRERVMKILFPPAFNQVFERKPLSCPFSNRNTRSTNHVILYRVINIRVIYKLIRTKRYFHSCSHAGTFDGRVLFLARRTPHKTPGVVEGERARN